MCVYMCACVRVCVWALHKEGGCECKEFIYACVCECMCVHGACACTRVCVFVCMRACVRASKDDAPCA